MRGEWGQDGRSRSQGSKVTKKISVNQRVPASCNCMNSLAWGQGAGEYICFALLLPRWLRWRWS